VCIDDGTSCASTPPTMVLDSCLVVVCVTSRCLLEKVEPPVYVLDRRLVKAVALKQVRRWVMWKVND
jgi:hypothetical protein